MSRSRWSTSTEEAITPDEAQQKVTRFVILSLGNQLHGGEPVYDDDRSCWAVPVVLTNPMHGDIGTVGRILVDAYTGDIRVNDEIVGEIMENAQHLVRDSSF
jgi:hypothetical protein